MTAGMMTVTIDDLLPIYDCLSCPDACVLGSGGELKCGMVFQATPTVKPADANHLKVQVGGAGG